VNAGSKSQKIRLGIFLTVSITVLIAIVLLITGTKLLRKRDVYHIAYEDVSVSGLEVGSAVKYHGIRVGRIEEIRIDPQDVTRVIVTISVDEGTPVKEDVKAVISMVGITGLKLIELTGGSKEAGFVEPGSFIEAGRSITDEITGKAEIISEKVEVLLNNLLELTNADNRENLTALIERSSMAIMRIDSLLEKNVESIDETMLNMRASSGKLTALIESTNHAITRLDSVLVHFSAISSEFREVEFAKLVNDIDNAVNEASKTFTHFDLTILKGRKDVLRSLELMKESLQNINEVSRMLTEDPSILLRGVEERDMWERR
jgi:phospholipid/cholesterol/gamma-HCH transport system substrate-binding protein